MKFQPRRSNESPRSRDCVVSSADYGSSAAELRGIRPNEIKVKFLLTFFFGMRKISMLHFEISGEL